MTGPSVRITPEKISRIIGIREVYETPRILANIRPEDAIIPGHIHGIRVEKINQRGENLFKIL